MPQRAHLSNCLSALPDDTLLEVLARRGCTRAAARTSIHTGQWDGLWTELPDVTISNVDHSILQVALDARASCPRAVPVSCLDMGVREQLGSSSQPSAAHVSLLLQAAARLSPKSLVFDVGSEVRHTLD